MTGPWTPRADRSGFPGRAGALGKFREREARAQGLRGTRTRTPTGRARGPARVHAGTGVTPAPLGCGPLRFPRSSLPPSSDWARRASWAGRGLRPAVGRSAGRGRGPRGGSGQRGAAGWRAQPTGPPVRAAKRCAAQWPGEGRTRGPPTSPSTAADSPPRPRRPALRRPGGAGPSAGPGVVHWS